MIKNIILIVLALSVVGFLVYLFSTPVAETKCATGILTCLEEKATLPFWEKMKEGFICLYYNVICVIRQ